MLILKINKIYGRAIPSNNFTSRLLWFARWRTTYIVWGWRGKGAAMGANGWWVTGCTGYMGYTSDGNPYTSLFDYELNPKLEFKRCFPPALQQTPTGGAHLPCLSWTTYPSGLKIFRQLKVPKCVRALTRKLLFNFRPGDRFTHSNSVTTRFRSQKRSPIRLPPPVEYPQPYTDRIGKYIPVRPICMCVCAACLPFISEPPHKTINFWFAQVIGWQWHAKVLHRYLLSGWLMDSWERGTTACPGVWYFHSASMAHLWIYILSCVRLAEAFYSIEFDMKKKYMFKSMCLKK